MMPLWLLASFVVEFFLLSLNVSVALFVAVQMLKRVPTFSTAFFAIYLLDSVVGCTHYLVYTFHIQLQGRDLFPSSWLNPDEGRFILFLTGYFNFFPLISHTVVALNRYTAIVWPARHYKLWSGKRLEHILIGLMVLPLIGGFATSGLKHDNNAVDVISTTISGVASVSIIFGTCVLSGIVETWTFWTYRLLSAAKKREYDFRLLSKSF